MKSVTGDAGVNGTVRGTPTGTMAYTQVEVHPNKKAEQHTQRKGHKSLSTPSLSAPELWHTQNAAQAEGPCMHTHTGITIKTTVTNKARTEAWTASGGDAHTNTHAWP